MHIREGVAMHRAAGGLLSGSVKERPLSAEFTVWRQNLREIRQLSKNMRQFARAWMGLRRFWSPL